MILFTHDLCLFTLPKTAERTIVCFHGYGQNWSKIRERVAGKGKEATLVSFNFPDHDLNTKDYDPSRASFGTIRELLPSLYALKKTIVDQNLNAVDLYGFSAGGGALVNTLAVLNNSMCDAELLEMGIGPKEKRTILAAIERGTILLDCPLKSVEEIIDFRGSTPELEELAKHYRENSFRPIDSLQYLSGLSLNIRLFFQKPDEVLSNRDDQLYLERLRDSQPTGKVTLITKDQGGHTAVHEALWEGYL